MRTPIGLALGTSLAALCTSLACAVDAAQQAASDDVPPEAPVELGRVAWMDDLDAALDRSRAEGKPVFALFQEIPGCATCRSFGTGPLSHPLLVEAIEELFVPLAIHNNRPGKDARVLSRFGEPAWNNPVVRFLDADGGDLIPRRDGVWSTGGIAQRAGQALLASDRPVPRYLQLVETAATPELARATFSMHCFWQGEAKLGALDGVATTRAGWAHGKEVVEVRYDPRRIDYAQLLAHAETNACAPEKAPAPRTADDSDRKYFLQRSTLRHLPLTSAQQTKLNAALGTGGDPLSWLSPRQRELHARIETALEKAPDRLDGLSAPLEPEASDLADYERRLRARLWS